MTKTLFVLPAAGYSTLSCVWIDRDLHIAGNDANIGSEISGPASTMEGIAAKRRWADQGAGRQKP
jgi:hypothetical protein